MFGKQTKERIEALEKENEKIKAYVVKQGNDSKIYIDEELKNIKDAFRVTQQKLDDVVYLIKEFAVDLTKEDDKYENILQRLVAIETNMPKRRKKV